MDIKCDFCEEVAVWAVGFAINNMLENITIKYVCSRHEDFFTTGIYSENHFYHRELKRVPCNLRGIRLPSGTYPD